MMTGLLGGIDYTMNRASYDLAPLRVNGLITRIPGKIATGSLATGCGSRSSTRKSTTGCCVPCSPPTSPPVPAQLRKALHAIDIHITQTIDHARLLPKAA